MLWVHWALVTTAAAGWRPPELEVADPPPVEDFETLQKIALQYLGRPYVMGGIGRPGLDCSGFTCRVFAEAGYAIPRVSRDQARVGDAVDVDALAPGDLLFFAEPGQPISHVGIYLGERRLVHASSGQGEVVVADLDQRWFRTHLVEARRILGGPVAVETLAEVELDEHAGRFRLPILLRVAPPRTVSSDPAWLRFERTHLGVRTGVWTEAGVAAPVVAPEAGLVIPRWGTSIQFAVPIRFEVGESVQVGPVNNFGDATRFLRALQIGLPDADLEVSLTRQRSLRLGQGRLIDRFTPGLGAAGVPGLTVSRTPLTGLARVALRPVRVETVVDDVVEPRLVGVGGELALSELFGPWAPAVDVSWAWDGGPSDVAAPVDVQHLGFGGTFTFVRNEKFEASAQLGAVLRGQQGQLGLGADLAAGFVHRFGGRLDDAWGLTGRIGVAGSDMFFAPIGLTFSQARARLSDAAPGTRDRGVAGGEAFVRVGPVGAFVEGAAGFGASDPLDERLLAGGEIRGLPLGGTRRLDLRLGTGLRALSVEPESVVWGSARMGITSFLDLEGHLLRGQGWQGGVGLRLTLGL